MDGISEARNFLRAKLLLRYTCEADEFHSYLLSINADVCNVVGECVRREWISGPYNGGIDHDKLGDRDVVCYPDYYRLNETLNKEVQEQESGNLTHSHDDGRENTSDTKTDKRKKTGESVRLLGKPEQTCIRNYRRLEKAGEKPTMKQVVSDYVAENGGSKTGVLRNLSGWKKRTKNGQKKDTSV